MSEIEQQQPSVECDSPDGRWHRRADGVWEPRYKFQQRPDPQERAGERLICSHCVHPPHVGLCGRYNEPLCSRDTTCCHCTWADPQERVGATGDLLQKATARLSGSGTSWSPGDVVPLVNEINALRAQLAEREARLEAGRKVAPEIRHRLELAIEMGRGGTRSLWLEQYIRDVRNLLAALDEDKPPREVQADG